MNEALISELSDAYQYLACVEKYDQLIGKYEINTETHRNKYYQLKSRTAHGGFKPWVPMIFILPLIMALIAIIVVAECAAVIKMILGVILAALLIAPFFASKISYQNEQKQNRKFQQEAVDYWQNTGGPAEQSNRQTVQKITSEKNVFVSDNKALIDVLPPDYQTVSACGFILTSLINGRADSVKEAINLYEETLHRIRLEHATQEVASAISQMQYDVMRQMDSINTNIDRTNSRLQNIENLEFYQTFFK